MDGERFPLRLDVIIFIAVITKQPISPWPVQGRDGVAEGEREEADPWGDGCTHGCLLPQSIKNDQLLMLSWITAGFWGLET